MKYKNRLAAKIAEKETFEKKQSALRQKYGVQEEGVIRITKKRLSEVLIKNIVAIVKTILAILHISLSTVGAICLLYPDTRAAMYALFLDFFNQAAKLLNI